MLTRKTLVSLVLGLLLALPAASAQTLSSADSAAIFDSAGKRVGAVQVGDENRVVLQVDGLLFAGEVERNGWGSRNSRFFESADCSGQPLFRDSDRLFPDVHVEGADTVLLADLSVPAQILVANSRANSEDSCEPLEAFEGTFLSTLEFPGLLAQFTPPFRVQVDTQSQGGTSAGPPSFPTVLRGAGTSSQVVVGAGDTALSVDSSFRAPDGSLIETQSVMVPPNGALSIDFEGSDLEFGSLALAVDPPDAHILSTEIISLPGVSPLGVIPSPLCTRPEFLMVESTNRRTAGAFSNPSTEDIATCNWEVFGEEGVSEGGGSFEVPPLGQLQFFPEERITLPEGFLGSFKAACDVKVRIFSLFQNADGSLTSNAAGCGEQ